MDADAQLGDDAASDSTTSDAELQLSVFGDASGVVTSNPAGIDCGADCSERFAVGTRVTLVATPASGAFFAGWTGCSGDATCEITLDSDTTISARFEESPSVLVTKAGTGAGTVTATGIVCGDDCNEIVDLGTTVTLSAVPERGAIFVGWSGPCTGSGTCVVTVTSTVAVTATFDRVFVFDGETGVVGPDSRDLGSAVNRACFLSGMAGDFLQPGGGTAYVTIQAGRWILSASSGVHAYAQCLSFSPASQIVVEEEQTYAGSDVNMGPTGNRVCMLTQMKGNFTAGGTFISIYGNGSSWILFALNVNARARCLSWPSSTVLATSGDTWTQGQPAKELGPVADRFCGFQGVAGRFAGLGELVYVRPSTSWFVGGTSAQTEVFANARCLVAP